MVPPPANRPRLGSITANFASGHATRMSTPPSISMPPAVQKPFTAAMIGFQIFAPRRTALVPSSRRYPSISVSPSSAIRFRTR